jgi:hypothetical protein
MLGARPEDCYKGALYMEALERCLRCVLRSCMPEQHNIRIGGCIPFAYIDTCELLLDLADDAVPECCSRTLGHIIRTEASVLQVGRYSNPCACHLQCSADMCMFSCGIGSPPLHVPAACSDKSTPAAGMSLSAQAACFL